VSSGPWVPRALLGGLQVVPWGRIQTGVPVGIPGYPGVEHVAPWVTPWVVFVGVSVGRVGVWSSLEYSLGYPPPVVPKYLCTYPEVPRAPLGLSHCTLVYFRVLPRQLLWTTPFNRREATQFPPRSTQDPPHSPSRIQQDPPILSTQKFTQPTHIPPRISLNSFRPHSPREANGNNALDHTGRYRNKSCDAYPYPSHRS
jgi:hypothetical protein